MSVAKAELTARLQNDTNSAEISSRACTKEAKSDTMDDNGEERTNELSDRSPTATPKESSSSSLSRKVTYKDYSHVLPEKRSRLASPALAQVAAKEPTFPVKLHQILSNLEFNDVICWLPHGRSWRILQQKVFEELVIPLYFRHGRYSSFARQVNGWGFRRVTHGSDYNSYYHEMFLRGMPHLCESMRRLTTKDSTVRKNSEDDPPPDFYKISHANPLPVDIPTTRPPIPESNRFPLVTGSLNIVMMGQQQVSLLNQVHLHSALPQQQALSSLRPGFVHGVGVPHIGSALQLANVENTKQLKGIGSTSGLMRSLEMQRPSFQGPHRDTDSSFPVSSGMTNFYLCAADRQRATMAPGFSSLDGNNINTSQPSQLLTMNQLLNKNDALTSYADVNPMSVPANPFKNFGGTNM